MPNFGGLILATEVQHIYFTCSTRQRVQATAFVTKNICFKISKLPYTSENRGERRATHLLTPKKRERLRMQIERITSDALVINKLPDGSTVIVDAENEAVFALNPTAGAAWDACSGPTTLTGVTESMQRSFHPGINEELAEQAILQLHDKNLLKTSGTPSLASRRQFITTMSSIALPLVVSLSIAEQRAYAQRASSAVPKPPACASVNPKCKP